MCLEAFAIRVKGNQMTRKPNKEWMCFFSSKSGEEIADVIPTTFT